MSPLPVSVVVPVFNGGPVFARCLDALMALDPAPAELLIVDDDSTDGSAALATSRGCRVQRTSGRSGPASARNLGVRETTGAVVLFVDADVLVPPDLIARVTRVFVAEPDVAAVIGCYTEATPDQGFFTQYKNLYQRYVHLRASRDAFTFWGACGAIRRDVLAAVGGFDPEYGKASIEDIELGYRLRDAGHRIRLDTSIAVMHAKRWTFTSLVRSDIVHRAVPWTSLILRAGRMHADLNLGWSHRLAVFAALLGLASLASAAVWPGALVAAALCGLMLLLLDAPLAAYFAARKGAWFTIRALGWQWVQYAYSGIAFAVGVGLHVLRRPVPGEIVRSNAPADNV